MRAFPASDDKPREGQYLPAGEGYGTLDDAHAPESMADALRGRKYTIEDLTPEWVITHLMSEATDFGTRTRQSARVSALGMLTEILQLKGEGLPKEDALSRAVDMPPEERRRLIIQKTKELVKKGVIKPEDLKHG